MHTNPSLRIPLTSIIQKLLVTNFKVSSHVNYSSPSLSIIPSPFRQFSSTLPRIDICSFDVYILGGPYLIKGWLLLSRGHRHMDSSRT